MDFNKYLSLHSLEDPGTEIQNMGYITNELKKAFFFFMGLLLLSYSWVLKGRERKSIGAHTHLPEVTIKFKPTIKFITSPCGTPDGF